MIRIYVVCVVCSARLQGHQHGSHPRFWRFRLQRKVPAALSKRKVRKGDISSLKHCSLAAPILFMLLESYYSITSHREVLSLICQGSIRLKVFVVIRNSE